MGKQSLTCPVCGGADIDTAIERGEYPIAFGEAAIVDLAVNRCRACGETGDFLAINDQPIEDALAAAEGRLAAQNVEFLAAHGHTMASCERALGLAPRTMMRWKNGQLSDAAASLLKIIRTFPWLLTVARANFSRLVADQELRKHAIYEKPRSAPSRGTVVRLPVGSFPGSSVPLIALPSAHASPSQGSAFELAS